LRSNSQTKKETPKQNNTTSKEDDKPWWEKRLEELAKGMEKANLRI